MVLLVLGCTAPSSFSSGGLPSPSEVGVGVDPDSVWVLSADLGSATRVDRAFERVHEVDLGDQPTALVETDAGPVVSLRGERAIARIGPEETDLVRVGAEPMGLASDGEHVYVALHGERRVAQLDGVSLGLVRSFEVDARPDWLLLADDTLWITAGDRLFRVDLPDDEVTEVELPTLATLDPTGTRVVPSLPRVTAPPIEHDGALLIPAVGVDTESAEAEAPVPYYGSSGSTGAPGRFNPLLLVLEDGAWTPLYVAEGTVRAQPATPTPTPDGRVAVPLPGADAVVLLDPDEATPGALDLWTAPMEIWRGLDQPSAVDFDALDQPWIVEDRVITSPNTALEVTGHALDPQLELGRRLFTTSAESALATPGSGVSCSTCHLDGRSDGNTWPLDGGARQTPALVNAIAPFTWTEGVDSVADEIHITSVTRMGGTGLSDEQADALAAWIETLPAVDVGEQDADAVERGAQVFSRAGCVACHPAPTYTNGASYAMFGLDGVDTPSLLGLADTAPYLHDGRAETLEELVAISYEGGMGARISEEDQADLVAFLASLEAAD